MNTYIAINTLNGKFYIGSSKNFEQRKKEHLGSKANYPFQNALRKSPEVFEWEVHSDGYEEPVLEQALLDMYFNTEQCYNLNPLAERPPNLSNTTQWKNELLQKQKRGLEKPKGESWEKGMLAKTRERRSGEKNAMFGIPRTEEEKKKLSEANSGENHPQYGRTGALSPNSKAVLAIKPDGTELHFGSAREAARELGINQGHLSSRYLKPGKQPKQGKWEGWQFRYENQ